MSNYFEVPRIRNEFRPDDDIVDVGAVVTEGNVPSERLFLSLGFERVGVWR